MLGAPLVSKQRDQGNKILLIGPLPPKVSTSTNPVGGTAVNFLEMVRQLRRRHIELDLVDTSRPRANVGRWHLWYSNVATALSLLWRVAVRIRNCRIVFLNMAAPRAWLIGSCVWMICCVCRRPMALRFFGGEFADSYSRSSTLRRCWADITYMRAKRIYVQTRQVLEHFSEWPNVHWFPNTRDVHSPLVNRNESVRRLAFVAQLRMEKGLQEAIEACRDLPPDCHLNVYGPRMSDVDVGSLMKGHKRATYCGVIKSEEVPHVLSEHDVLVLPSYWKSEGYPGIIIEAFQCGVPVISTRWGSISEVVEHGKSGLLVAPRSISAVKGAIEQLIEDPGLYRRLCEGARSRGDFFRSGVWYDRMAADLRRLGKM